MPSGGVEEGIWVGGKDKYKALINTVSVPIRFSLLTAGWRGGKGVSNCGVISCSCSCLTRSSSNALEKTTKYSITRALVFRGTNEKILESSKNYNLQY